METRDPQRTAEGTVAHKALDQRLRPEGRVEFLAGQGRLDLDAELATHAESGEPDQLVPAADDLAAQVVAQRRRSRRADMKE